MVHCIVERFEVGKNFVVAAETLVVVGNFAAAAVVDCYSCSMVGTDKNFVVMVYCKRFVVEAEVSSWQKLYMDFPCCYNCRLGFGFVLVQNTDFRRVLPAPMDIVAPVLGSENCLD